MCKTLSAILITVATLVTACDDNFDPPSLVTDFRLLAMRAEPPEVGPGDVVELAALVADPHKRTATYAWYACILPQLGDAEETPDAGGNLVANDPYGSSCASRVHAGVEFAFALGGAPTAQLTVPPDIFANDAALALGFGFDPGTPIPQFLKDLLLEVAGLNYTVELIIEVDGRRIAAHKRVNVSQAGDESRNANPAAPFLHVSDSDAPSESPGVGNGPAGSCFASGVAAPLAGHEYQLMPLNVPDPGVDYSVLVLTNIGAVPYEVVTGQEALRYAIYATGGELSDDEFEADGKKRGVWRLGMDDRGAVDLWVVVRDGRGGIAWCHEPLAIAAR